MLLMHGFVLYIYAFPAAKKVDVINSNVDRNERSLVTLGYRRCLLWNRRFQNLRILHAFARHLSNTKMNFSKRFSSFLQVTK